MPRAQAGPISADRLKSFVERIERLNAERDAIGADIREVYGEAKGVGYDVKTMRKVVAERKIDPADRDEQEALLDVYRQALGQASYRDVAERFGISKSKLHRLVPREKDGTDEIETAVLKQSVGEGPGTVAANHPAPALASIQESCGGVESRHAGLLKPTPIVPEHRRSGDSPKAGVAPGPQDTDIGTIPAFLDRSKGARQ